MCAFGPDRAQSQRVRDTDTPEPRARVRLVRLRAVGRGRRSPHSLGRLSSLALGLLFARGVDLYLETHMQNRRALAVQM